MKKSFKKSIAVLLAVLMVVCTFPLTAFAAEKPNVNLQFGVFSLANSASERRTYSVNRFASTYASKFSGLMAAKLDYNKSAGTLTDPTDSYTYAVGDYFTATVLLENVSQLAAAQFAINYSSNIAPAGICNGEKEAYAGEATGVVSTTFKAGEPVAAQSGNAIYNTASTVGELSYIDMDTNTMYASFAAQDGSDYVSTASTAIGVNTFTNTAVLATFAFKITAEGPISFSLANTADADEAYCLSTLENGGDVSEYITYAPTENAGSTGLNFMGGNEYVAATKYTVTFKNEDGSVISSAEYDEGTVVTVPALPAVSHDETNHYTYNWDVTPSTVAVADATYQIVKTGVPHIWGEGVVTKEATATEDGEMTYTCTFDGCGAAKTEVIPATGEEHTHTWGEWVYNGDASYTSSTVYTDGTATRTCACGETETKTIAGTGLLRARTATAKFESELKMCIGTRNDQVKQFKEVYCVFTREDGVAVTIPASKSYVSGANTFFDFGVTPQGLNSPVVIRFYGITNDDITVWGDDYTYVMTTNYILKQLRSSASSDTLKNLFVEMLYYGYENQVYSNWDLEHPLTDLLTDEEKARHTTAPLTLNKYQNVSYVVCENPETSWKSVSLVLGAATKIKYRTKAMTLSDDLKAVVEVAGESEPYTYYYNDPEDAECFAEDGEGGIYFTFPDLAVKRLRSKVYVTLYKGDTPIINTFEYSAETYAYGRKEGTLEYPLTQQQMRFADAARAYFNVTD